MSKNKLFESIDEALKNKASAVRMKLFLEPAGGSGDKFFHPLISTALMTRVNTLQRKEHPMEKNYSVLFSIQ